MTINDDDYADLIDNYVFDINLTTKRKFHNIFIDHVDHSGESNYHHHHPAKNGHDHNVVNHNDDCDPDDNIYVGHFNNEFDYDLKQYGPRNHDHG